MGVRGTPVVEEEAATVAASRVAAPGAVMVVVSSFAALPHLVGGGASVCFLWAREGATLFLAASNVRFVVSEDALRLHVHAGSEAKTKSKVVTLAELKQLMIIAAHLLFRRL